MFELLFWIILYFVASFLEDKLDGNKDEKKRKTKKEEEEELLDTLLLWNEWNEKNEGK